MKELHVAGGFHGAKGIGTHDVQHQLITSLYLFAVYFLLSPNYFKVTCNHQLVYNLKDKHLLFSFSIMGYNYGMV
jgi:hypothetical protein